MTQLWDRFRSPFGRKRTTKAISVTLWGKADCSLCDKALDILERLSRDYPIAIQKRDIVLEPDVFERYRYVIPVVEIAGGPTFEGKITEHRLRQAIQGLLADVTSDRHHRDRSSPG